MRKFGCGILNRPYGLAFDTKNNLIVVDANMKAPYIFTFNRKTGQVIKKAPYEPVMSQYAESIILKRNFEKDLMHNNHILPFDKSKIRFMCCNQDYLYASDLGRSLIFKTDLNGQIKQVFGRFGKLKGELYEPSGIHVDYDGESILVGDSKNDRLQVKKKKIILFE